MVYALLTFRPRIAWLTPVVLGHNLRGQWVATVTSEAIPSTDRAAVAVVCRDILLAPRQDARDRSAGRILKPQRQAALARDERRAARKRLLQRGARER
jgi:hypothetical protein